MPNRKGLYDLYEYIHPSFPNTSLQQIVLFGTKRGKLEKTECCFTRLIDHIFKNISLEVFSKKERNKILSHIHNVIEDYFNGYEADTTKVFKKYRRDVLIGYILLSSGYPVTKKLKGSEPYINDDLSFAIKNTTKALLKKEKSK